MISTADERAILGRYATGQDALRIAADLGRVQQEVAELIGKLCGFDRGRARQMAAEWDRVTAKTPAGKARAAAKAEAAAPTAASHQEAAGLRAEVERLRGLLRQHEGAKADLRAEVDRLGGELARRAADAEALRAELDHLRGQQIAAARAAEKRIGDLERRIADARSQMWDLAAWLKDPDADLDAMVVISAVGAFHSHADETQE